MPPRPRTPRPRPGVTRRPRVAGMSPTGRTEPAPPAPAPAPRPRPKERPARPEERRAAPAEPPAKAPEAVPAETAREDSREDAGTKVATADTMSEEPARRSRGWLRAHAVPLLAIAFVVLATAAAVFGVLDAGLRGTPAATNTALVDVGGTAEAAAQLSDALETVYSFDFTRLDENEAAARAVITPGFAAEFDRLFGEVRQRAPEQKAVVSATVTMSAVKELAGDRAVMVAFVDQIATRAAADPQSQQLAAAGRLRVTGERVDGHWKIAAVTPL